MAAINPQDRRRRSGRARKHDVHHALSRLTSPSRGRVVQSKPPHLHVLAGGGPIRYFATRRLESTSTGTRIAFMLEARIPRVLRRRVEDEASAEIKRLARLAAGDVAILTGS